MCSFVMDTPFLEIFFRLSGIKPEAGEDVFFGPGERCTMDKSDGPALRSEMGVLVKKCGLTLYSSCGRDHIDSNC